MRFFLIASLFFLLQNCNKPKAILICGDHECVNKSEANKYFEENLSIEVKIVDKNNRKEVNLLELNLNNNSLNKEISINKMKQTKREIKILNNGEIKNIKKELKKNKRKKKVAKKIVTKKSKTINKPSISQNTILDNSSKNQNDKNTNKNRRKVVDICTIVKKCIIDEISKYLIEQEKNKDYPDITEKK